MTRSTVETTVRPTLDDIGIIELSCSARTVHLGVRQQADDRRAIGVDEQWLRTSK